MGALNVTGALTGAFNVWAGASLSGTAASLIGNVVDSGTVQFNQTTNGVFAGRIIGSGALIKAAAGVLVLNADSSIATTTVVAGVLEVGDATHATVSLTSNVTVDAGASLTGSGFVLGNVVDNGSVQIARSQRLHGVLSGSGVLEETGGADLVLGAADTAFSGRAEIGGGVLELASAQAIGTGSVVFVAGSAAETLRIDAADAPAAGSFFGNMVSGFSGANDTIDLSGLAYVSVASVSLNGHALVLHDGGKGYGFHLAGAVGASFTVASDGHGGTLITANVASFAQAISSASARGFDLVTQVSKSEANGHVALLAASARTS